jgi:hypothetical protein
MENTANIGKLTDVMLSLTNVVQRHDDQIAALVESGKTLTPVLRRLPNQAKKPTRA